MTPMPQEDARWKNADLTFQDADGRVIVVEVKDARAVSVRDMMSQAEMYISGASAAAVGAASLFGWYVRSDAPWAEHADQAAIRADWQTVGDDLWRAAGLLAHTRSNDEGPDQSRLFDPAEFGQR
jgi:hypothetical protein